MERYLILSSILLGLILIFNSCSFEKETDMVFIPGGKIGPDEDSKVDSFYIDKYEVTNQQYKEFIDYNKVDFYPRRWKNFTYPKGEEDFPVTDVNFYEAQAYCTFLNKRLPTEEEWEKASLGDKKNAWPWGNEYKEGFANIDRYGPRKVGSFKRDKSIFGVYDMAGNVAEWTSSWLNKPSLEEENSGQIVIKGGAWLDKPLNSLKDYRRGSEPDQKHLIYGFRCVKRP